MSHTRYAHCVALNALEALVQAVALSALVSASTDGTMGLATWRA